jgi:hypothetical protein
MKGKRGPRPGPDETKTSKRGTPGGPPVRGVRGRSTVSEQEGFALWLEDQLLEVPRPSYSDIAERMKATAFYASRSALARYGLQFEARKREIKLLLEQARILAAENEETILTLEKATSNLAETKLFKFLLEHDKELDEQVLGAIATHSRLQASSAARERATTVAAGKFTAAMRALQRKLEEYLARDPATQRKVVQMLEAVHKEATH